MQKVFLNYDNPIASYPSTLVIISVAYATTITSDHGMQQSIRSINDALCPSITTLLLFPFINCSFLLYLRNQFFYICSQNNLSQQFLSAGPEDVLDMSSCISNLGPRGFREKKLQKADPMQLEGGFGGIRTHDILTQ